MGRCEDLRAPLFSAGARPWQSQVDTTVITTLVCDLQTGLVPSPFLNLGGLTKAKQRALSSGDQGAAPQSPRHSHVPVHQGARAGGEGYAVHDEGTSIIN